MLSSSPRQRQSYIAAIVALFAISCATAPDYRSAATKSVSEICDDAEEPLRELDESSKCGQTVLKMTGQAACESDDATGCLVAATYTLALRGNGGVMADSSFEEETESGIDYATRGCNLGNELACVTEGVMILQSAASQSKKIQTFQRMDQKCRNGMGTICLVLGFIAAETSSGDEGKAQAAEYQKLACDAEVAGGCFQYAAYHEEGFGVETSVSTARGLYKEACDLGAVAACEQVGAAPPVTQESSVLEEIEVMPDEFVKMTKIACDGKFRHACTLAGAMLDRGQVDVDDPDRLAVSFYESGCSQGAPASCFLLALKQHVGKGTDADTPKAASTAKKACDLGLETACELALEYAYRILDESQAEAKAAECTAGDPEACFLAGGAFNHGANFPVDRRRSLELHIAGCDLDFALSCTAAGYELQYGPEDESARDPKRANPLYAKACEFGDEDACQILGVNYAVGAGVEADMSRAVTLLDRACTAGSSTACGLLGNFYAAGDQVERDIARAEQLYRKGCAGRYVPSCHHLAAILENAGTDEGFVDAITLYRYACEADHADACNRLGELYVASEATEKKETGVEFFERACLLEQGPGCTNLANVFLLGRGAEQDQEKAVRLLTDTCEEYTPACIRLGDVYRDGTEIDRAPTRAVELYSKACELENYEGCTRLGWLYIFDGGVEYEPKRTVELYQKACELGSSEACEEVRRLFLEGHHVGRDPEASYAAIAKSCERGNISACNLEADHHFVGFGVPRDVEAGKKVADKAHATYVDRCETEGGQICGFLAHSIAHRHGAERTDFAAARDFLAKSCDGGEIWSCHERAEQRGTGELYERDREASVRELRQLCTERQHQPACIELAYFTGQGEDDEIRLEESLEQYERLCEDGHTSSCIRAGHRIVHGTGTGADTDPKSGLELLARTCTEDDKSGCDAYDAARLTLDSFEAGEEAFERAKTMCTEGLVAGCRSLVMLHANGVGTEPSPDAAYDALQRACKLSGEGVTCAKAKSATKARSKLRRSGLASSCSRGKARTCPAAGLAAEWGTDGESASAKRAATLYRAGCDAGNAESCRLLYYLDDKWEYPVIGSAIYRAVETGCTTDAADFCESAGRGISSHHWPKGVAAVQKACAAKVDSACMWLVMNGEKLE